MRLSRTAALASRRGQAWRSEWRALNPPRLRENVRYCFDNSFHVMECQDSSGRIYGPLEKTCVVLRTCLVAVVALRGRAVVLARRDSSSQSIIPAISEQDCAHTLPVVEILQHIVYTSHIPSVSNECMYIMYVVDFDFSGVERTEAVLRLSWEI